MRADVLFAIQGMDRHRRILGYAGDYVLDGLVSALGILARIRDDRLRNPWTPQVIPDIDIWRCAALMVNNHGEEAAMEAATMADDFLSKGNIEAQRV